MPASLFIERPDGIGEGIINRTDVQQKKAKTNPVQAIVLVSR